MTKRRIHLTESQLHRLIEQSINELDRRTYKSAANKRERQAHAEENAYDDKYAKDAEYVRGLCQTYGYEDRLQPPFVRDEISRIARERRQGRANYEKHKDSAFKLRQKGEGMEQTRFDRNNDKQSYYDRRLHKWLGPEDDEFDPKVYMRGESIARRVTESVMRKLRGGVNEANGAPNRPSDSLHLNWYEWTQMVLRKLKKLLVGKDVIFRKTVYGRDNRPRGENRMCRITSISINNGTEMTNTDYCFNIWMINSDNGEKELTPMGEMRMACLLERGWGEGDWGDIKLVDGAESLPQEEAQEMIAELGGTEWMQYCADYNHIQ